MMRIGIIGAMEIEVRELQANLTHINTQKIASFLFHKGFIDNVEVVVLQSGIGKVSAAIATTLLIEKFHPNLIINTGTAGGLGNANVFDIIIATEVQHHDVDVTVFGYKIGQQAGQPIAFRPNEKLVSIAKEHTQKYVPNIITGLVVSGDSFINKPEQVAQIQRNFPTAKAVEMEASAIAQVCTQMETPFIILRAISDMAGEGDAHSYETFVAKAGKLSAKINIDLVKQFHLNFHQ